MKIGKCSTRGDTPPTSQEQFAPDACTTARIVDRRTDPRLIGVDLFKKNFFEKPVYRGKVWVALGALRPLREAPPANAGRGGPEVYGAGP